MMPPASPKKNRITSRPMLPMGSAPYQMSVLSAQRIAITITTATIVQKIAITNPIASLIASAAARMRTTPATSFRRMGVRCGRASSSVSILEAYRGRCPGSGAVADAATASVKDALEVLEAKVRTAVPALEPQPGQPVAPHGDGTRLGSGTAPVLDQYDSG